MLIGQASEGLFKLTRPHVGPPARLQQHTSIPTTSIQFSLNMTRHEFTSKSTVMVTYIPTVEDASTKHRLPGFSLYADPEALEKWRASTGL